MRAKERKGEEGKRETWEDIQINTCVFCQVVFFCCLVFSPSPILLFLRISLPKHTFMPCPQAQQPLPFQVVFSCSKLFLPLLQLPWPFCVSTKPLHKAFGKRTDLTPSFHAFSSSYNLMLIKTSAQGSATYQHKENTGTLLSHSTSMQQDMF